MEKIAGREGMRVSRRKSRPTTDDHKTSGGRLEKLEEMHRNSVRQKDGSGTEWGSLQKSDQAINMGL